MMKQETAAFKFTCKNCKKSGLASCSGETPFIHCHWYTDYNQEAHDCIYCRACGATHDITVSMLGGLKKLLAQSPYKVLAVYTIRAIKRMTRISDGHRPGLRTMDPLILEAMRQDGRLAVDEDLAAEPTIEFLAECLEDKNRIVRREAVIALKKFDNQQAVDLLEKIVEEDESWEVAENAEIVLDSFDIREDTGGTGETGGFPGKYSEEPPENPQESEQWQYFGYGRSRSSFDKLRRRRRRPKKID